MLQQTQVSRVEQYYGKFLLQYPTVRDLAVAAPAQVRQTWQGLGYYRRATNLHRLAVSVVEERNGIMPESITELERLPGVGRYTAGAVATFAYEQAEPAVDTNVERVIRRAFFSPRTRVTEKRVWGFARTLVPRKGNPAWTFNQAIMELGALVCTARIARCDACPVRSACRLGRKQLTQISPSRHPAGRSTPALR